MIKKIIVTTSFEAVHNWPDCSIPEMDFLKNPHRHIFFIELKKEVSHNDRDIEIIQLKRSVNDYLKKQYSGFFIGRKSCEDIAEDLYNVFGACFVSVKEDNENGAEITDI